MNTSAAASAPPLALGTMNFGTRTTPDKAFSLLDRFVRAGGRWIDTANCYAFWLSESGRGDDSERTIGEWLKSRPEWRGHVLVSTKVGAEPADNRSWRGWPENREGLSRAAIFRAVEGSLGRLGVDRIDLLWLHQEDRSVSIEESVDAVAELMAQGVVDRVGASNHPAWRVERARAHALARGIQPIDAVQLSATYLRPRPDARPPGNDHPFGQYSAEQRDHALETSTEVWAYTPLLRGAYDAPERGIPDAYRHDGTDRRLDVLRRVAVQLGATPSQVVLAWLVGDTPPVLPVVGVSSVPQLDLAIAGASLRLPTEARAALDGAAP